MTTTNSSLREKYNLTSAKPSNTVITSSNTSSNLPHKEYDNLGTNELINVLQKEYVIEEKKNKQLSEKNYDALKKELVDFSSQYSGLVYQHITLLEKTSKQYERIVNDNLKKEKAKLEYEQYLREEKIVKLLNACEKIQLLKKSSGDFLMHRRTK